MVVWEPSGFPANGVQLFDIAVVRSDGHHVVLGQGSIHHLLQGPADVTAGIQLGGGVLGVADDITVGEVGDDEVVFPQGARHSPGHLRQGELRLLVKVDAFGRGTHTSSSPGKEVFSPPLKKKVTWANFSDSAQWNWVFPASERTWAKGFTTCSGAKAMGRCLNLS